MTIICLRMVECLRKIGEDEFEKTRRGYEAIGGKLKNPKGTNASDVNDTSGVLQVVHTRGI